MVAKIIKEGLTRLGSAVSPGTKRTRSNRRRTGSRYIDKETGKFTSEKPLVKRGAVTAGAGAAGAGATGAALASDDSESTRRRVDRRGRPLKSQTNGKNEAATEKSNNKRQTRRGMRAAPATTTPATKAKNYNVGVSKGGVPFAESFKYHKDKGQKTFTWNGKRYTTEVKGGGKTGAGTTGTGKTGNGKTSTKETSDSKKTDSRNRSRKRLMRKAGGGMMAKKGYAKGGMTKKGYKSGGLVNGKPRGVGAALRGYGKALKLK